MLFAEVKQDKLGYYSSQMTKDFSGYLKKINAKTAKTSFHSLRHNFEDECIRAGVPSSIMDALQGHVSSGMSGRYGKRDKSAVYELRDLHEAVESLEYPSLSLRSVLKFQ